MICKTCGMELSDTAAFCPNCGNRVVAEAEPEEATVMDYGPTEAPPPGMPLYGQPPAYGAPPAGDDYAPTMQQSPYNPGEYQQPPYEQPQQEMPQFSTQPYAEQPYAAPQTDAAGYNTMPQGMPEQPMQNQMPGFELPAKKRKKLSRGALIGIIAGGVVAVALIAFLVFRLVFSGWVDMGGNRYYYENGNRLVGMATIEGADYFFDANGVMQTGLQAVGGQKYYFQDDGVMLTNSWIKESNRTYYFGETGAMATGWQSLEGCNYYFDTDGAMMTGWQEVDGMRYYLGEDGVAATGWLELDGAMYYFDDAGAMQTGELQVDGKFYHLDEQGTVMTGWQKVEGKTYYFQEDGSAYIGWIDKDGARYYCAASIHGAVATGKWSIGGEFYYFNSDGVMQTGEVELNDTETYTFDEEGRFLFLDVLMLNVPYEYGAEPLEFDSLDGTATSYSMILTETVKRAWGIGLTLSVSSVNSGDPNGVWQILVQDTSGHWTLVGYFDMIDFAGTCILVFPDYIDATAIVCCAYDTEDWSGSVDVSIDILAYETTDFGAVAGTE